jgi:hypothetical protein
MPRNNIVQYRPLPVPASSADLLAKRKSKATMNDADRIEGYYVKGFDDGAFRAYATATDDMFAIEGKVIYDRARMALAIKAMAEEANDGPVATMTLDRLVKAINVVSKRFEEGLSQRRMAAMQATGTDNVIGFDPFEPAAK